MSVRAPSATDHKSLKSEGSKNSINVTLPATETLNSPVQKPVRPSQNQVPVTGISPRNVYPARSRNAFSGGGSHAPLSTPTHMPNYEDQQLKQIHAARTIERAWLAYQDRQMFKLLKHAVCAAENSLSLEILKKVSPKEADLLKDKAMHCKVRFRFGGGEFPPQILFKIYMGTSKGAAVNYVSGKKMIKPASEAAQDACDLMGNRRFYDQMIQDSMQHQKHRITDEVDITTLKDYMQYMSLIDETPSYMGGRDNLWRRLTLDELPRRTIFYDVVNFLYNQKMSDELQMQLPSLLANPLSQEVQVRHIDIISQTRPRTPVDFKPYPKSKYITNTPVPTARRSKQARNRANKMRQAYEQGRLKTQPSTAPDGIRDSGVRGHMPTEITHHHSPEEWEEEANKLYEWTQELSFDELLLTPRIATAKTQFGVTY